MVHYLDADLENIVIGQIEKIEKHPDADKLIICQVNVGNEVTQIVTGAPNVKEGDKVPVVLKNPGGRVAGGGEPTVRKLRAESRSKPGKLRGCGFHLRKMCSKRHRRTCVPLKRNVSGSPENGIYIFPEDIKPGDKRDRSTGTERCGD